MKVGPAKQYLTFMLYDMEQNKWGQSKSFKQWHEHSTPLEEDKAWLEAKNQKLQELGVTLSSQRPEFAKKKAKTGTVKREKGEETVKREKGEEVTLINPDDVIYSFAKKKAKRGR